MIKEKYNKEYSNKQIGKILREYKMILSKPYPIDYRQPEEAEEILEERLVKAFEEIKNKAIKQEEIAIGFLDEASPQNKANTVRVWSFGKIEIKKNTTHLKTNCAAFYTIKGNDYIKFMLKSKKENICELLQEIKDKNKEYKAIIIILDNYKPYKCQEVKDLAQSLGIYLVYLPPYSPNYNPIEQIWRRIKRVLSTIFVDCIDTAKKAIQESFSNFSSQLNTSRNWISRFFNPIFNNFYNSHLFG